MLRYQGQHQIQRSRSTRACQTIPVDNVEAAFKQQMRRAFFKRCGMFPMHGHAPLCHQAGIGQNDWPTRHPTEAHAKSGDLRQPIPDSHIRKGGGVATGNNKQIIKAGCGQKRRLRRNTGSARARY